jgi:molecular chaperone HtpG
VSERLTDSPVCLVSDEGDIDIHLERLLRQHNRFEDAVARVLEVNPTHPLIAALAGQAGRKGGGAHVADAAWLLLDQARILGGEPPPDPTAFTKRLSDVMTRAMGA